MFTVIIGGERSGKSRFAQDLVLRLSDHPVYIATARVWDEDFARRIDRHRLDRGPEWQVCEEEKHLRNALPANGTAVIDCITLWLTNIFMDNDEDVDATLAFALAEIDALRVAACDIIVVTNEIGMGVHAMTASGRKFTELQGRVNQYIAATAKTVVLMVAGIPMTIKEDGKPMFPHS
ncbi:MAG TPA: bifunctional adenosylcobinamide kinase/adenosylcobinamide-phosphate guanylyltransferase [Bacteroidota bacterium]|nr:bifunctional adenosylcobinamide kinase/adenosylcobinamide-phosphate guanylyltransferase [Bacteroidota bacterium]